MPPVHVAPMPDERLLERIIADWRKAGWSLDDLHSFRMEGDNGGESELDDLSESEIEALQSLSDDDTKKLKALTPEQIKGLQDGAALDARIRDARNESATRRRELKPWKELGKELNMTPDEIRDAIKKGTKPKPKPKGDGDGNEGETVDAEEVKRAARLEAERTANRKVVKAEVKVLARDLFASPDDAPLYVDLDEYDVDDDGDLVDPDQLISDLKEVLKKKPHLAKKPGKPKPDKAQGTRGTTATGADAGRSEAERRFGDKKKAASSQ